MEEDTAEVCVGGSHCSHVFKQASKVILVLRTAIVKRHKLSEHSGCIQIPSNSEV